MDYIRTIKSQASSLDQRQIKALQEKYLNTGTEVLLLSDRQYIIQKCPELFYKLLELTELRHHLKATLAQTPSALCQVTTNRMLEIELIQTTKLAKIKIDKQGLRNVIISRSSKQRREANIINFNRKLTRKQTKTYTPLLMRKQFYDYTSNYLTAADLNGLGPVFRNKPLRKSVSPEYRHVRGLNSELEIYDDMTKVLNYLNNDDENIFIKVAIVHYLIEYTQPFSKYNGLYNRLLTANYLYPQIGIGVYALSNTLVQNKSKYYQLIEETADDLSINDLTAFVYNFICYIIDSINYITRFLEQNNKRTLNFKTKLEKLDLSSNQKLCLEILHQASLVKEPLTTTQLTEQSGLTNPTVLKCMTKLEQCGFATITKPGKQKVISLNQQAIDQI